MKKDWLELIGFISLAAMLLILFFIGINLPKWFPQGAGVKSDTVFDTVYVDRYHCDEHGNLLKWNGDTVKPIKTYDEQ